MTTILEKLAAREELIYRDGRHYVPLFVLGGGSKEDERVGLVVEVELLRRKLDAVTAALDALETTKWCRCCQHREIFNEPHP